MSRIENWDAHLFNWSWEAQRTPFEWGKFDCALMAASAVEVLTGEHPCPHLIGAYQDGAGAVKAIKSHYGTCDFSKAAEFILGNTCDTVQLISGSVAYIQLTGRKLFSVKVGSRWLAPAKDGAIFVEPLRIIKTWRVG